MLVFIGLKIIGITLTVGSIKNYNKVDFSNSDAIMGRTISCLVKIGWSKKEVKNRAIKMREAIESVL